MFGKCREREKEFGFQSKRKAKFLQNKSFPRRHLKVHSEMKKKMVTI